MGTIEDESRRRVRETDAGRVVFDVLIEAGIDTGKQPSSELVKPMLMAAYRGAREAEGVTNDAGLVFDHLDRMTDSTGLIQHAIYSIPRRESGYTTDDNARALRLCARAWNHCPDAHMLNRVTVYLSFLEHARCPVRGFHNFLSYQRDWLDAAGTGDCQGQAVLALAEVVGSNLPNGYRALARELIDAVLPTLADLRSLRAEAYVILAWGQLLGAGIVDNEQFESVALSSARRLVECYHRSRRLDWSWFESRMTYANAVLPHALFVAAQCWPQEPFLEVAFESFGFLDRVTTADSLFWPVGNCDWYPHGEAKALYDQQPVEAATMADAAQTAFRMQNDEAYLAIFHRVRRWFLGENSLDLPLADIRCGACYDGLMSSGVNRNQGAESTLSWLWVEMQNLEVEAAINNDRCAAVCMANPIGARPIGMAIAPTQNNAQHTTETHDAHLHDLEIHS